MPSRRDQIQSYQFFMQRVVSAFVAREPDPAQSPFRKLGGAGLGGVMVAVIFLAAVGVYGFIFPGGSKRWQDGRSVIQEKETGALYVYRENRLHPVANYASALLAMENAAPTMLVSSNSLVGTPRGPRIGIPDAPTALPNRKRMLGGAWTLCNQPARDETGRSVTVTALTVGRLPSGGRELGDLGLLVRDSKSRRLYLVWHDHRYEITNEKIVLEGLALGQDPQLGVGAAWWNALPAGRAIGTRNVADRGQPSKAVAGTVIGRIYFVAAQGGSRVHYLAERDVLSPLTALEADILLADPATMAAYGGQRAQTQEIGASVVQAAPKAATPAPGPHLAPPGRPQIARLAEGSAICATYRPGATDPTVLVEAAIPPVRNPVKTAEQTSEGTPLADRVLIEPGYGALVTAMPSADAPGGIVNLVTDLGFRYPLASDEVIGMLGYGKIRPVRLPASLVVRLPSGPSLDPAEAKKPIDQN